MVIAGPGSGKTTVITHRVKYLIENGIDPNNILVITYTKAAATHMEQRYTTIGGKGNVTFSTFHSLFFRILRRHTNITTNNLLIEDARTAVLKSILKDLDIDWDEETLQSVSLEISLINNDLLDIDFYKSLAIQEAEFRVLFKTYKTYKEEHDKIDFDDMLTKCYDLLLSDEKIKVQWQQKYKYIMIDEFQDINKIQYHLIKLLCETNKNIYIVGDDDQSIYKFRGARPQFLLNFPKDFEGTATAVLDINYRSSDQIIKLSNNIIKHNDLRYKKIIKGTNRQGDFPILIKTENIDQEAVYIAKKIRQLNIELDEICVVYRTNIQSRALIDAFSILNIPYKSKEEMPVIYEHFVAKDILAYLQLALDKNNNDALERIVNKPKRYINKGIIANLKGKPCLIDELCKSRHIKHWQRKPIEELVFHLSKLKKMSPVSSIKYIRKVIDYNSYIKEYAAFKKIGHKGLYEVLSELTESSKNFKTVQDFLTHAENFVKNKNNQQDTGVQLSTMHGVKGLEYKVVFVISCVESLIPHERSHTKEDIEEERRLFYVAVTRAKDMLYLSIVKTRYEEEVKPTRFLSHSLNL